MLWQRFNWNIIADSSIIFNVSKDIYHYVCVKIASKYCDIRVNMFKILISSLLQIEWSWKFKDIKYNVE